MHGGIVHQRSLMQVQVDAVVGLQLKRSLYGMIGEHGLREIAADGPTQQSGDFAQA